MFKKLLLLIILILSLTAVSAADNTTDIAAPEEIAEESVPLDGDVISDDMGKNASQITADDVKGYESFSSTLDIQLTSDGKPLANRPVKILVDDLTFNKITDAEGKASVYLQLVKGTYTAQITYDGDNATEGTTATATITIKDAVKTKLKLGDKYIYYRQGSKGVFYVKLLKSNNKAVKNQMVTFRVAGKTYTAKTNKNGVAKIYLNLKKGKYKVKYSFNRTSPYLSSSGAYKIKVHKKLVKGDGYWVWSAHMKKVNLKSLAKHGTKNILLHANSLSLHGKSAVVSFIKKAHKYGMKVHLWMQVCYSGGKWVKPVNPDGSLKYGFMNKKIAEAKRYAKITGVDGVHFDYVRFGGSAHLYKTSVKAINYFVKKASTQIHKIKANCIVSAAIMPEPNAMLYYYGQDVPTMSRYVDVLMPMVYKGNYHQTRPWITKVTQKFTSQSNGAQVWTGLQSYRSDNNANKLSHSELLKDAKAAIKGGAYGVMLFRYGISCNLNFKKV